LVSRCQPTCGHLAFRLKSARAKRRGLHPSIIRSCLASFPAR
jgi:hypothetical protein